jgi:MYXO-CTERM domain-containing protein
VDYLGWIKDAIQPPQVTIDAPADGATVALSVLLQVTATDSVGVASVEALVDDASVEILTAAPYDFALTLTSGAHTIKVVAKDAVGNSGSAQVTVTATDGPLPDGGVTHGDATMAGDGAASGDGAANRPRGEDGCSLGGSGDGLPVTLLLLLGLAALRRRAGATCPRSPGR